jgi:DNA-directed RNA polymerase specialized sigma24 family protein
MPRMVTGSDFGRLVEQEFRRLRRYVPALTIDQEQADDLVQDCLAWALAKQYLWQPDKDGGGLFTTTYRRLQQPTGRGRMLPV